MDWSDRIGRRIRLRDLHIVLAVAEAGSMAKAPQKLAISHPVVSKTISDLEHTLGVRLFDRTSQGVELTTYGRALLKCGVNVFDEMRQGLKQIEFLTDPTSGELAVGCPEIMNAGILPAISERFLRQHPRRAVAGNSCRHRADAVRSVARAQSRTSDRTDAGALCRGRSGFRTAAAGALSSRSPASNSQWARRRRVELADLIGEVLGSSALMTARRGRSLRAFLPPSGLKPPRA